MNKKPECAECPYLVTKSGWTVCKYKGKADCKWNDVTLDQYIPKCPNCESDDLEINGLYYKCRKCGHLDDSTFEMLMSPGSGYVKVAAETMGGLPDSPCHPDRIGDWEE